MRAVSASSLLARTVTAQDPWKRGLWLSGVPVAALLRRAPRRRALLSARRARSFTTLRPLTDARSSTRRTSWHVRLPRHRRARASGRCGGRFFEARSLGRYRLKRRLAVGRHGRRLGRVPPGSEARRGREDPRPETQERSASARRALRARGARHRGARAPEHRAGLRLRHDRGRALVLRHGAARGRERSRARRRASARCRPRAPSTSSARPRARSARRTSAASFTATSSPRTCFSPRSAASTTS